MQGDPEILAALNDLLAAELSAINQYFIHSKIDGNLGYAKLAEHKRSESMEEMHDAETVIDRILYLEGKANMEELKPLSIREDIREQHQSDLDVEIANIERLNKAIALCRTKGDHGTQQVLEEILQGEERAADWLETQLSLIDAIGIKNYLAQQIGENQGRGD